MKQESKHERKGKKHMAVFTANCDRMFSVGSEDAFRQAVKKDMKKRQKADETVAKISKAIKIEGTWASDDKA